MAAHKTLIFYAKIACCIAWTFMLDYALYCWATLIIQNPTDYLRMLISNKKSINDPAAKRRFNALVDREEAIAREKMSR